MAAVHGNVKLTMKQRLEKDQKGWLDLVCNGVDKTAVPATIDEIDTWIGNVGTCLNNGPPENSDKIVRQTPVQEITGIFSFQKSNSNEIVTLAGGTLMYALGNNNDCLIHSFLTCISPTFRTFEERIRSTLASYFRRFVLPIIVTDAYVKSRLESYVFLTGAEIDFLSNYYKIPIINIQDEKEAVNRSMEIFPQNEDFWADKGGDYTGPFYMIHGDNNHFTPVAYNGDYKIKQRYADLKKIASDITEAVAIEFGRASDENEKLNAVKEEFIERFQPTILVLKQEVESLHLTNENLKSQERSRIVNTLRPDVEWYIKDIITRKMIDQKLEDRARGLIITTLLDEFSGNEIPIVNDNSASGNSKVLRSMKQIKAKIGTGPETQYSATVYKPVSSGGKRKTKKVKRAKKQKTKKLKRSK